MNNFETLVYDLIERALLEGADPDEIRRLLRYAASHGVDEILAGLDDHAGS